MSPDLLRTLIAVAAEIERRDATEAVQSDDTRHLIDQMQRLRWIAKA